MTQETVTALRWVVVAALTASAAAHVPGIEHHLIEAPYMGVLFFLYTGLAAALALLIALRPARADLLAAVALCGAALVAYAVTRLVALPQLAHDVGHWRDPLGVLAVLAELVTVVAAAAVVRHRSSRVDRLAPSLVHRRPAVPRHQGAH